MDLLTIQILFGTLWWWKVFTIEGHNSVFALRDGKLNKWFQHFFEHLHV
jgi:hypothetical protein